MRIGYNTNGFASHRLWDALEVIVGLRFRSVAVTLDGRHLDPFEEGCLDEAKKIGAWLDERDVLPVVETGARFLLDPWRKHWPTLLSRDEENHARRIDFLRRSIDVARAMRAPVVSLWSGSPDFEEPQDALDQRLVDGLSDLVKYAADRGVTIGFEPEPGMYVEDMAGFDRIAAQVPGLALTLDVGHAHITEPSAIDTARERAAQAVNVHIEGMFRDRHDHLLPDEGDMDLAAVLHALADAGYTGPANFELSRHSHQAVTAARQAANWLDKGTLSFSALR